NLATVRTVFLRDHHLFEDRGSAPSVSRGGRFKLYALSEGGRTAIANLLSDGRMHVKEPLRYYEPPPSLLSAEDRLTRQISEGPITTDVSRPTPPVVRAVGETSSEPDAITGFAAADANAPAEGYIEAHYADVRNRARTTHNVGTKDEMPVAALAEASQLFMER